MSTFMMKLIADENGQDLIEYALLGGSSHWSSWPRSPTSAGQ